jgi:P-type Cu+ transporter
MKRATDPVCGMEVDPTRTTHRSAHGGTSYLFCSRGCKERFDRDPAKFVHDVPPEPAWCPTKRSVTTISLF